jgi:hypothetical protein
VSFIQWIFLFGGLAVVGPVIAHLLAKPRFRRLPFTMLRFLHTGQIESQSRRKLRDLLILLLRCAIIVLIAMLFAQPVLRVKLRPEEIRSVYCLGLDNSMSMAYSDGSGSYFNELVDSAIDYIRSAKTEGLFNICALASGDWVEGLSKEQALAEVQALKIAPGSADVGDFLSALDRANRTEHLDDVVSVLVLSDFTPKTLEQFVNIEEPATVDNVDYKPIASPKPINNAAIIDARAIGIADGKLTINVTVVNYGQVGQNRQLIAEIGPNKSVPVDINLSANQRRIYQTQIDVDAAEQEQLFLPVELSLSAGDGLKEDDTFYLAVSIPRYKNINVILADNGTDEMFLLKTAIDALSRMSSYDTFRIKQVLISELKLSDLDWADVIVCSAIVDRLGYLASGLKNFVRAGGRLVFFVTERIAFTAARQLWQQDVLPALPARCIRERSYIQPKPCDSRPIGVDNIAAKSLSNYRIDKILLNGYFECKQHPDSKCLWRLQNDFGFVYFKRVGNGTSILVNTSVDDSLGSLTKSSASIAFCRYLLGENNQIGEHSFAYNERVTLPVFDIQAPSAGQKQLWVETCDGRKRRAAAAESFVLVPDPGGIGWVKTLAKPTMYAGINLPDGETDMTKPVAKEVANIMSRVFPLDTRGSTASAEVFSRKKHKNLWKIFAWTIILLLLVEPAVTNRLKR